MAADTRERVEPLFDQGLSDAVIAQRLGLAKATATYHVIAIRRERGLPPRVGGRPRKDGSPAQPVPDHRGIWTPEKLEKARRLFGKTMIYIAEALQVPPKELLEYGLNGVLPPMGKAQRIAALLEDRAEGAAPDVPPEPSRGDDEAELAALDEDQDDDDEDEEPAAGAAAVDGAEPHAGAARGVESGATGEGPSTAQLPDAAPDQQEAEAPPAAEAEPRPAAPPAGHLYRLTNGAGSYLHESLDGMTLNRRYAWRGTTRQMEAVFRVKPAYRELDPERA